jgi:2-keto-4-pentenoate hydratase/2-oxohepta-3-ene-1,7-dioic acid hydratase in catechol pathway
MKLATFLLDGKATWGVVADDSVSDCGALLQAEYPSLKRLIAANAYAEAASASTTARKYPISAVEWLPVIPDPAKILCIGLNYEKHRVEAGRDSSQHPSVFTRFADTQLGHGQALIRPFVSEHFDYEGELAIVIGRHGRHISRDDAMDYVAGYACYNDASVRDWQRHTIQFTPGKNFPGTGAFGPYLVTADEIPDYRRLKLETRLNGNTVQLAGLDQLIFPIPVIIEYLSTFTPLAPGDVIATGTPGGVGFKRQPPLFMKAGDRIEVEISGVGTLVNSIVDER